MITTLWCYFYSSSAYCLIRLLLQICNEGGAPLGYFDWPMLTETALNGIESAAMFGAAAVAMEYCFNNNFISKFR